MTPTRKWHALILPAVVVLGSHIMNLCHCSPHNVIMMFCCYIMEHVTHRCPGFCVRPADVQKVRVSSSELFCWWIGTSRLSAIKFRESRRSVLRLCCKTDVGICDKNVCKLSLSSSSWTSVWYCSVSQIVFGTFNFYVCILSVIQACNTQ